MFLQSLWDARLRYWLRLYNRTFRQAPSLTSCLSLFYFRDSESLLFFTTVAMPVQSSYGGLGLRQQLYSAALPTGYFGESEFQAEALAENPLMVPAERVN